MLCTTDVAMLERELVADEIDVGDVLKDKRISIKKRKTPYIISLKISTSLTYKVYLVQ